LRRGSRGNGSRRGASFAAVLRQGNGRRAEHRRNRNEGGAAK